MAEVVQVLIGTYVSLKVSYPSKNNLHRTSFYKYVEIATVEMFSLQNCNIIKIPFFIEYIWLYTHYDINEYWQTQYSLEYIFKVITKFCFSALVVLFLHFLVFA